MLESQGDYQIFVDTISNIKLYLDIIYRKKAVIKESSKEQIFSLDMRTYKLFLLSNVLQL